MDLARGRRSGRVAGAAVFGLLGAFACGGRASSVAPVGAGGGGGSSDASVGQAQGAGQTGSLSGSHANDAGGGGGLVVTGGATGAEAGDSAGPSEPACDDACLAAVVSQNSDFGMPWQSSWFLIGCKRDFDTRCISIDICPNAEAPSFEDKGAITLETFPIGGVKGQHYKVTFTFNAIAAIKEYEGGKRDQGESVPADLYAGVWDSFYRDGSAIASNAETWRLSVFDDAGTELRHYYMNSVPKNYPTSYEGRSTTYSLAYTKSIVVVGGGKVTHRIQDSNCSSHQNCGPNQTGGHVYCDSPLPIPSEPTIEVPALYQDPEDGKIKPTTELTERDDTLSQPWRGQLGHLTITAVEETSDPVTQDYP